MLTGGVGGDAPRAWGPSSPRLRPPLQEERKAGRKGIVSPLRKEEKPRSGRAWAKAQQENAGKGGGGPLSWGLQNSSPLPLELQRG